jgi:hypothetical protein
MRAMIKWEYCRLEIALYREGTSNAPARELYTVTMPDAEPAGMQNTNGRMGVMNLLGSTGWELVAVDNSGYYFKRPTK